MEPTTASATELRESIMALTRQLRRHRSDNGLTLSQQQVLGEVIRAGVTTPAELAMRMHVRVQSLTDGINHLESSGLVARRTDAGDRRRQLIEATADGVALLEADRAERDEWLNTAMRETLTELEFNLLMLVAPVLRKLADGDERPREEQTKRDERPREEQTIRDERQSAP
ncbi:MAG: transcriptional regulator, MarR family [Mycobacterium sp.]|nr:transcriptional regulator, MarR family [Mycobacterium sp.]